MSIKILKDTPHPLLDRREVVFEILHPQQSTPSRKVIREKLAGGLKADPNATHILKAETKTNAWLTFGLAHIYDSPEKAKLLVPEHILNRKNPEMAKKKKEKAAKAGKPAAAASGKKSKPKKP